MFILESLRHYFLGRVTVYLAQLVVSTEPFPFFCLQTLIPVTRKPTRWVACSRWSTSHSYLFVWKEKKTSHSFSSCLHGNGVYTAQRIDGTPPHHCLILWAASMPPAFSTYYSFLMAWKIHWLSDDCFHETVQHGKRWLSLIVQLCRV